MTLIDSTYEAIVGVGGHRANALRSSAGGDKNGSALVGVLDLSGGSLRGQIIGGGADGAGKPDGRRVD